jgi:hydroxymethylbilane synthase
VNDGLNGIAASARQSLVLGTRGSTLALRQTEQVRDMLERRWPALSVTLRVYETFGDTRLDIPFPKLADDAFTDQIERALIAGEIDAAVHSYKDLPMESSDELVIAAVPIRADMREALVARDGLTLRQLPAGAVLGTSSERRAATLRALRPDIELRPIRGAVDVRLDKVLAGEYDAVIFAVAGLERLGLAHHITEYFSLETMPPAAGQGALAVQCRTNDARVTSLLEGIDDVALHDTVRAERQEEIRVRA